MAFAFDAHARLAELRRDPPSDPIPPILPTFPPETAAKVGGIGKVGTVRRVSAHASLWGPQLETIRAGLHQLRRTPAPGRVADALDAAQLFLEAGWTEKALTLGWPPLALFGADRKAPWERLDRMGVAYLPFRPIGVTDETITYASGGPRPLRARRADRERAIASAVFPWEITDER